MLGPLTFGAASFGGTLTYSNTVAGYGPIMRWRFNETSGTVVTDYGSAGVDADYSSGYTLEGGVDPAGNAIASFASSSLVDLTTNLSALSSAFPYAEGSLVVWIKPPRGGYLNTSFIFWSKFANTNNAVEVYKSSGVYRLSVNDNRNGAGVRTFAADGVSSALAWGWVPIVYTWKESTTSAAGYLHGSEWFTGTIDTGMTGPLTDSSTYLTKNAQQVLAEYQIYNYALTAAQAADLSLWTGATKRYFVCGDSKATDNDYWINEIGAMLTENDNAYWREEPARVGLSGQTTAALNTELSTNFPSYTDAPEHVFVNVGANDLSQGTGESTFKTALRGVIDALQGDWPNAKIWLTKPYREDVATPTSPATLAGWIDAVVAEYGANVTVGNDETGWFATGIATYSSDNVHYNNAGHVEAVNQWEAALGY